MNAFFKQHSWLNEGVRVRAYEYPLERPRSIVVFSNANWVSHQFLLPLARYLAQYRIQLYTLSTRGSYHEDELSFDVLKPSNMASDILSLCDYFALPKVNLVGFCTGCENALMACTRRAEQFEQAVLVNGAFSIMSTERSERMLMLEEVLSVVAESRGRAYFYFNLFNKNAESNDVAGMFSGVKTAPEVSDMIGRPFKQSPEMLQRYAATFMNFVHNQFESWQHKIDLPCFFISSENDDMAHMAQIEEARRKLKNSTHIHLNDSDHFSLYDNNKMFKHILEAVLPKHVGALAVETIH